MRFPPYYSVERLGILAVALQERLDRMQRPHIQGITDDRRLLTSTLRALDGSKGNLHVTYDLDTKALSGRLVDVWET